MRANAGIWGATEKELCVPKGFELVHDCGQQLTTNALVLEVWEDGKNQNLSGACTSEAVPDHLSFRLCKVSERRPGVYVIGPILSGDSELCKSGLGDRVLSRQPAQADVLGCETGWSSSVLDGHALKMLECEA